MGVIAEFGRPRDWPGRSPTRAAPHRPGRRARTAASACCSPGATRSTPRRRCGGSASTDADVRLADRYDLLVGPARLPDALTRAHGPGAVMTSHSIGLEVPAGTGGPGREAQRAAGRVGRAGRGAQLPVHAADGPPAAARAVHAVRGGADAGRDRRDRRARPRAAAAGRAGAPARSPAPPDVATGWRSRRWSRWPWAPSRACSPAGSPRRSPRWHVAVATGIGSLRAVHGRPRAGLAAGRAALHPLRRRLGRSRSALRLAVQRAWRCSRAGARPARCSASRSAGWCWSPGRWRCCATSRWRPAVLREGARWAETGDIALVQFVVSVLVGADVVLVALLGSGTAAEAGFQALATLAKGPVYVAAGTVLVAFPLLRAGGRRDASRTCWRRRCTRSTALALTAAVVLATVPTPLVTLFLPDGTSARVRLLPALAVAGLGYGALTVLATVLLALRLHRRTLLAPRRRHGARSPPGSAWAGRCDGVDRPGGRRGRRRAGRDAGARRARRARAARRHARLDVARRCSSPPCCSVVLLLTAHRSRCCGSSCAAVGGLLALRPDLAAERTGGRADDRARRSGSETARPAPTAASSRAGARRSPCCSACSPWRPGDRAGPGQRPVHRRDHLRRARGHGRARGSCRTRTAGRSSCTRIGSFVAQRAGDPAVRAARATRWTWSPPALGERRARCGHRRARRRSSCGGWRGSSPPRSPVSCSPSTRSSCATTAG